MVPTASASTATREASSSVLTRKVAPSVMSRESTAVNPETPSNLELHFIANLHHKYLPRTVKVASGLLGGAFDLHAVPIGVACRPVF
jgi:hypothetical protein